MRWLLSIAAVWATCSVVAAQSVKLPATINQNDRGLVIVVPESVDGDSVTYFVLDPGLQLIPPEEFGQTTNHGLFIAVNNGTYRIRAVTGKVVAGKAKLSSAAECTIVIGPPTPPPPPPPPPPTDPFTKALYGAYGQETDTNKATYSKFLAGLFANGNALVATGDTAGTLFAKLSAAIHGASAEQVRQHLAAQQNTIDFAALVSSDTGRGLMPKGSLPLVMAVLGNDLNTVISGKPGPMPSTTPVPVPDVQAAFAKYAKALGAIQSRSR